MLLETGRVAFEVLQVDRLDEIYDDRKRTDFTILFDRVEDGRHKARDDRLGGEGAVGGVKSGEKTACCTNLNNGALKGEMGATDTRSTPTAAS